MITIESISKKYADIQAVDKLSLDIRQGEIMGMLGPNGAGKSTTISMLCGLVTPDSGSVTLDRLEPKSAEARKRIGLIPQSIALYEELTALHNLNFFADLYDMAHQQKEKRINWALEFVGLQDRAKDSVSGFSGGMKRRLNLAASLLHDPDYIFMDEPTAGVDPQSRNKLLDSVLELKKLGKTVIYTTHYMEEAQKLCDRVAVIDNGKLLALDSVDNLITTHGGDSKLSITTQAGTEEFLSKDPAMDISKQLASSNEIYDLKLARPDLETVFLNLTGKQLRD